MKNVLKENKQFVLITSLLVVIGSLTSMITLLFIQYFNENKIKLTYEIMLFIVIVMLFSFLLQTFMLVYRENFAAKFNSNYLFKLISKLTKISYDGFIEKEPTYLINRIFTSVDSLYLFLINSVSTIVKSCFVILLSLGIVGFISWKIFLLLLILLPLNLVGFKHINKQLSIRMEKMQKDAASANKDLIVTLSNVDNIKSQANVSALEHLLKPKMIAMYDSLANNNKYAQVTSNAIVFINQLVQNMTYIWASILIVQNEFPVGNLIILSIVIPMYYSALSDLSKANVDYKSLTISNEFIKNNLDLLREENGEIKIQNINNIEFNFPSFLINKQIFNYNLKEVVNKGDIVYIEGDSGSGKTSLLRLMLKFRKSKGIKINGLEINSLENSSLRNKIAYISQDPTILSTSLENNIGMGRKLTRDEKYLIETSGILSPIFKEKHWDSVLLENGANLSGGEKQRIAVCRLIISDAELYILDESISNIDKESANAILNFITIKSQEKIILYTTHDKSFKKYANKIINVRR
ncbi:ATP-binding cassette domain-containing protein [Enterococcus gallinarum]|uniref:ATP-binding cassette domain-containing protein n=1 Tax=Enterococcus gallinarum TaxID=1353 RepID=UPI001E3082E4|nr:ABC transporter ATP-binding protein [Enterococcus gallinarum]MCD5076241.1 ABC transporter ATP-binding protein [Enterococcus gallinarum]